MANGSYIGVTPGTGAKLATGPTYSEGGNTVQDQKVIWGEPYLPNYVVSAGGVAISSTAHLLQLMAGASNNVRIRRIEMMQEGASSAAALILVGVLRLTTAGTGGTAITPGVLDTTDAAATATVMSLPTVKGATSAMGNWGFDIPLSAAQPIAAAPRVWEAGRGRKPIIIPAGISNGVVFWVAGVIGTITGATLTITVEFTETTF